MDAVHVPELDPVTEKDTGTSASSKTSRLACSQFFKRKELKKRERDKKNGFVNSGWSREW